MGVVSDAADGRVIGRERALSLVDDESVGEGSTDDEAGREIFGTERADLSSVEGILAWE